MDNGLQLGEGGTFSTNVDTKNLSSNLAQMFIRSTSPRISPNSCYRLAFFRLCCQVVVCRGFRCHCRVGCAFAVLKIFEGKEILKNNFSWVGKVEALLQTLVCGSACSGLHMCLHLYIGFVIC